MAQSDLFTRGEYKFAVAYLPHEKTKCGCTKLDLLAPTEKIALKGNCMKAATIW